MKRFLLAVSVLLMLGGLVPQASGRVVIVTGTCTLNGGPAVEFHGATSFSFAAGAGDDMLRVVHPAQVAFAPARGIDYDGGANLDVLEVLGAGGAAESSYTPGNTPDSGAITYIAGGLTSSHEKKTHLSLRIL